MHLVGSRFEPVEVAVGAVPVPFPVARKIGGAVNDPPASAFGEINPGDVRRYAGALGQSHQVGLAIGE